MRLRLFTSSWEVKIKNFSITNICKSSSFHLECPKLIKWQYSWNEKKALVPFSCNSFCFKVFFHLIIFKWKRLQTPLFFVLKMSLRFPEAYLEPSRTSKTELFAKIVYGFQLSNLSAKSSILDVRVPSECASGFIGCIQICYSREQ